MDKWKCSTVDALLKNVETLKSALLCEKITMFIVTLNYDHKSELQLRAQLHLRLLLCLP